MPYFPSSEIISENSRTKQNQKHKGLWALEPNISEQRKGRQRKQMVPTSFTLVCETDETLRHQPALSHPEQALVGGDPAFCRDSYSPNSQNSPVSLNSTMPRSCVVVCINNKEKTRIYNSFPSFILHVSNDKWSAPFHWWNICAPSGTSHLACSVDSFKITLNLKFIFLHIQPYNKDIYNHLQFFAALSWQQVQFWKLKLMADVTASWKQRRSLSTQTIRQKNPQNTRFKSWKIKEFVCWCPLMYWQQKTQHKVKHGCLSCLKPVHFRKFWVGADTCTVTG